VSRNRSLACLVLLAGAATATAVSAQQMAPPPVVQPAPSPEAEPAAAPVVRALQVAPVELTGLMGHTVVGAGGTELGRIVDLLADSQGRVRAVVVDVGGFMGVGNRKVALAWSALRFAPGEKGPVMSIVIPPDRITSWADYIVGRPVAILGAPDDAE
jgi:PRC-barrel domain